MKKILFLAFLTISFLFLAPIVQADYITISHQAFTPSLSTYNYSRINYLHMTDASGWMQAPVYLPDGAIIDALAVFYWDGGTGFISTKLQRTNSWTGNTELIFNITPVGNTPGVKVAWDNTCTPSLRLVRNNSCSYFINIYFNEFGDAYRVYSVRIRYHIPTP